MSVDQAFAIEGVAAHLAADGVSIILKLPKAATEQFLAARKSQWLPEQVGGLFLNIHYENQHLSCVTGLSLNQFTLDKTLEREWDESIRTFLRKEELPFEE